MNTNEVKTLDWKDNLLIFALLAFTSFGTFKLAQIVTDAKGLTLFARSILTVCVTEGALIYWHNARSKYVDAEQRKLANIALWVSLAIVTTFSGLYTLENVLFTGGMQTFKVNVSGTDVPLTVFVGYVMTGIIVIQIAGTLAVIFHIENLSPVAVMAREAKQAQAIVNKRQLEAFRTAQAAISGTVGTAQAIAALRAQLAGLGYTEREIEQLAHSAIAKIEAERIPVNAASVPLFENVLAAREEPQAESFFVGQKNRRTN